jgi:hypothetical protein
MPQVAYQSFRPVNLGGDERRGFDTRGIERRSPRGQRVGKPL